jgi:hypothetical protein
MYGRVTQDEAGKVILHGPEQGRLQGFHVPALALDAEVRDALAALAVAGLMQDG